MPKLHEKEIIRLEPNEVAELLDFIESCGDGLSNHQRAYYEKTKERDFAIITLLLGTGIRVSECVGLDIEDVDFKNNGIKVLRKGGNEMFVYFGDEVAEALKKYIEVPRRYYACGRTRTRTLLFGAEKTDQRQDGGKSGEEICVPGDDNEENYAA